MKILAHASDDHPVLLLRHRNQFPRSVLCQRMSNNLQSATRLESVPVSSSNQESLIQQRRQHCRGWMMKMRRWHRSDLSLPFVRSLSAEMGHFCERGCRAEPTVTPQDSQRTMHRHSTKPWPLAGQHRHDGLDKIPTMVQDPGHWGPQIQCYNKLGNSRPCSLESFATWPHSKPACL